MALDYEPLTDLPQSRIRKRKRHRPKLAGAQSGNLNSLKHGLHVKKFPQKLKTEWAQIETIETEFQLAIIERWGTISEHHAMILDAVLRLHGKVLTCDRWIFDHTNTETPKWTMEDEQRYLKMGMDLVAARQRELEKLGIGPDPKASGGTGAFPADLDPLDAEGDNATEEATGDA